MKRLLIAMVFCGATLAVMGQQSTASSSSRSSMKNGVVKFFRESDGKVRCTISDKACTEDQVEQFNAALTKKHAASDRMIKGSIMHSIGNIRAKGGYVTCDGKPCTEAQVADLNKAGASIRVN